jgi:hypothetical protein
VMVDELRAAILEARGAELARELMPPVPPAFADAADDRLALRLHGARIVMALLRKRTNDGHNLPRAAARRSPTGSADEH